ncbi:hypothetical protein GP486_005951 [Trichoglossum hirsutum]|uniref:Uncharacterized protein n=1 Tax=Trichoglossum hirsutum TaxID=265104 RepID=A0A9P8L883_9PEZI|nr:hypothetical protein GP486_005951 [Trichoglossum hirsutum]
MPHTACARCMAAKKSCELPNQHLYDLLGGLHKYVKVLACSYYVALTPEQKKFVKCPLDPDDEPLDKEWKDPVPSPIDTLATSDDDDDNEVIDDTDADEKMEEANIE